MNGSRWREWRQGQGCAAAERISSGTVAAWPKEQRDSGAGSGQQAIHARGERGSWSRPGRNHLAGQQQQLGCIYDRGGWTLEGRRMRDGLGRLKTSGNWDPLNGELNVVAKLLGE